MIKKRQSQNLSYGHSKYRVAFLLKKNLGTKGKFLKRNISFRVKNYKSLIPKIR